MTTPLVYAAEYHRRLRDESNDPQNPFYSLLFAESALGHVLFGSPFQDRHYVITPYVAEQRSNRIRLNRLNQVVMDDVTATFM
jgi:hypothetical protein